MLINIGCDSGGEDQNENEGYAVLASLSGVALGSRDFKSNEVATNIVGDFSFGFTAVDGDVTILVSVQSLKGEPLTESTYEIGADESTQIVAGGSVVNDVGNNTNAVYNAEEGSGTIVLEVFSSERVSGTFEFTAGNNDNFGTTTVTGEFDLNL